MKVDDDPVVKELPVYLSKTLANQLYIIQYPFYQKDYKNTMVYNISIKPKNQKLRMELLTDTENIQSYDRKLGEELALNAETDKNEKRFSSGLMDKIVLASGGTLPQKSNYAVGIFQDGELHITPLKNMMQMKVHYDYLDEKDKRVKEGTKNSGEEDDEDEDIPSPVKVTFARHLPESVKKKREQSFHHHAKKTQEEQWIHTSYRSPSDSHTELTRLEIFSQSPEILNAFCLEPIQYIQRLMPQVPEQRSHNVPENQLDLHDILIKPLLDQIRIIMKRVQIISFARLRQLLLPEHDSTTILKYLQQVAVLVQGNWIVNSELIYPKDAQNAVSELMCKARDYILLLFTEQQFVYRNTLSSVIKLKPEEIDEIFKDLATYVPEKGWQLKELPNWNFCERHSEIVQRQELYWDVKRKHLRETLETQNQAPQRQRRKSHRESIGSENEERNVGRGRKSLRDSSLSDDSTTEPTKHKKSTRSKKASETM